MRGIDPEPIATDVVDAAVRLHRDVGPGMLESFYGTVFTRSLRRRGRSVHRQVSVPFWYDGLRFDQGFKVDLLIEGTLVVELKASEKLAPVHFRQLLTYLKLLDLPLGLLINFGAPLLREGGIRRVLNDYRPTGTSGHEDAKDLSHEGTKTRQLPGELRAAGQLRIHLSRQEPPSWCT